MPPLEAATPEHRQDDVGRQGFAMLGSSQISNTAKPQPIQEPSPAAQAARAKDDGRAEAALIAVAGIARAKGGAP
jgi:hypothetical protein